MKIRSLAVIIAGLGRCCWQRDIANPAKAQTKDNNTYYCAQLDGNWNTFVNTPRGQSYPN